MVNIYFYHFKPNKVFLAKCVCALSLNRLVDISLSNIVTFRHFSFLSVPSFLVSKYFWCHCIVGYIMNTWKCMSFSIQIKEKTELCNWICLLFYSLLWWSLTVALETVHGIAVPNTSNCVVKRSCIRQAVILFPDNRDRVPKDSSKVTYNFE